VSLEVSETLANCPSDKRTCVSTSIDDSAFLRQLLFQGTPACQQEGKVRHEKGLVGMGDLVESANLDVE